MTILNSPWKHHNAQEYEWLRSEDSYLKSIERGDPERLYKQCQYTEIKSEPVYSIENSKEPENIIEYAYFTSPEDKIYSISKRLVDLEGQGRWHVGDFLALKIRGCCNIVGLVED